MKSCIHLCTVFAVFAVVQPAEAGQFVVDEVWFANGLQSSTRMSKRVGASAIYQGTLDLDDNHWAIQAPLVVGGTTHHGFGMEGSGVFVGKRITCQDSSCGGFHEFDRCPETTYSGYGVAAIYHQFNPDISRKDLWGGGSGCSTTTTPDPGPLERGDEPTSPIVIDLDHGGFRFSDLTGGVMFDLDGDGVAEWLSWLAVGSGDAWLALDRDGDGTIGSGLELFGDSTPQPPATEPNGYLALAVFDTPAEGGDGDGAITAADAVYSALRLWFDADHDGVSQPAELVALRAAGVVSIGLDFVDSHRRDEHGNELRYAGRVQLARGVTQSADVFLLGAH